MTDGSTSHLFALEYALKPLLATLKAQSLKGLYFQDKEIGKTSDEVILDKDMLNRTKKQLRYFLNKISVKGAWKCFVSHFTIILRESKLLIEETAIYRKSRWRFYCCISAIA